MIRRPPRSTRTDTLFPYTTLFRSPRDVATYRASARLLRRSSSSSTPDLRRRQRRPSVWWVKVVALAILERRQAALFADDLANTNLFRVERVNRALRGAAASHFLQALQRETPDVGYGGAADRKSFVKGKRVSE